MRYFVKQLITNSTIIVPYVPARYVPKQYVLYQHVRKQQHVRTTVQLYLQVYQNRQPMFSLVVLDGEWSVITFGMILVSTLTFSDYLTHVTLWALRREDCGLSIDLGLSFQRT